MISATIVSGSVISCEGSAASRSRMVEYWLWSATHMSTGFGEFTKGSQNCFKTGGWVTCHSAAVAITSVRPISATAGFLSARKVGRDRVTTGSVATGGALRASDASLGNTREVTGGPLGWPGQ